MSNVFKLQQDYVKERPRNNFPLSYTNNLTTKFARITPIMCKETIPGDKFRINTSLGIRALPMVFPVQTPVQVEVEFYYAPVRILWPDFKDFVGRTKQNLVHPYLSIPYTRASEIATGTLADYLGVPTTYAGAYGSKFSLSLSGSETLVPPTSLSSSVDLTSESVEDATRITGDQNYTVAYSSLPRYLRPYVLSRNISDERFHPISQQLSQFGSNLIGYLSHPLRYIPKQFVFHNMRNIADGNYNMFIRAYGVKRDDHGNLVDEDSVLLFTLPETDTILEVLDGVGTLSLNSTCQSEFSRLLQQNGEIRVFFGQNAAVAIDLFPSISDTYSSVDFSTFPFIGSPVLVVTDQNIIGDVDPTLNPFVIQQGETKPACPLSVLPFRMYEACMNYFKRNEIVDPFILNGETEYNRYVTNLDGGADSTTPLNMVNRLYELDYLTSSVPSPQQGIAPLIGVVPGDVNSPDAIFEFEDVNNPGTTMLLRAAKSSTGQITGIEEYDPNIPQGSIMQLEQMIQFGISIQSLRSVNALQVWLEENIRRGFKYERQMLSHFGVNVSNLELQEPIFIGGFTRNLSSQQVTATAKSDGINLGDYGGQATLFAQSKHDITYTCQEHGFILATLTITPIPSYSQLLPKMFLKSSPLDYHFNEFNHIGYQPITYRQVCPIQSYVAGDDLDDVFGYQRPDYDLIANVDEQHSRMRTDFMNFLITRVFGSRPQLGHDFITCSPENLTSPFVDVAADADNFICQVYFDIVAKRQVSKVSIARLEP